MLTFNGKTLASGETEGMRKTLEALCNERFQGLFESLNVDIGRDPAEVTFTPIGMPSITKYKSRFEVTIKLVVEEK